MTKKKKEKINLFDRIESVLQKHPLIIIGISTLLALLFSILLFNPDVSLGGDDSGYIKGGHDFYKGIAFPGWHGSFYSILLSFFIMIAGVNIIFLKFTSVVFFAASFYFIYQIFRKATNHTTATIVVIITSVSYLLNKYASTTFSESFFFFLQSLYIFLFYNYMSKLEQTEEKFKNIWKDTLILGVITYILIQTRSISMAVLIVSLIFLLLNRKFLSSLLYTGFAVVAHFIFDIYKRLVWNVSSVGFEDQLEGLLLKDYYKPAKGNEDLTGIIQRFWDNSELYLSKHLTRMFGIKSFESHDISAYLTIAFYVLFAASVVVIIIKNKKLTYVALYAAALIGTSFISLQKIWDQERLIMIYFPLILGVFVFALFSAFSNKKLEKLQLVPVLIVLTFFILIFSQTIKKVSEYNPGNRFVTGEYMTYSPDWQNYMQASRWAANNLPSSAVVVCRKPEMSWIASEGKSMFKGVYRVEYTVPDSAVNLLNELGATHVISANLRLNPTKKNGKTIATIANTLSLASAKYPGCLTLIKEFGNDEKAYILKLDFPGNTSGETYSQSLDAALIVNPKNNYILQKKAEYFIGINDYPSAIKYYDITLQNVSNDKLLFFNRGYCYFQQKKYPEALKDFKKASELDPSFGHAWYNLAVCLFNTGEYQASKEALDKAKKTNYKVDSSILEGLLSRYVN